MASNVVECTLAEKDDCMCKNGATLAILKDVQRAYEERMDVIERVGGANKLQMQVCVLRSWVGDLVAQNSLLARAVEELEQETVARVAHERRRQAERIPCHESGDQLIELRIANDTLQKENMAKDREIRRLKKDIQQCELTLTQMRNEISLRTNPAPEKKDAEVMAGMCCTGTECGDLEPVKDVGELLHEETRKYRERIQKMELSLKSSGVKVRAVHKINLGLIEELSTLRRLCVAVDLERRDARLRLDLEGQIVKQMLKQLRQAKAKESRLIVTSTPCNSKTILRDESEISAISLQHPRAFVTISDASMPNISQSTSECDCQQETASHKHEFREQLSAGQERPKKKGILKKTKWSQTLANNEKEQPSFHKLRRYDLSTKSVQFPDEDQTKFIPRESEVNYSFNSQKINTEVETAGCSKAADDSETRKSVVLLVPIQPHEKESCDLCEVNRDESEDHCAQCQCPKRKDENEATDRSFVDDDELKTCPCTSEGGLHQDDTGSNFIREMVEMKTVDKADSGGGSSCAGGCEEYYRNKLSATLRILENKEETIRVQGSSLSVAESRIAALTERACALRRELDQKAKELNKLQKFADNCQVEKNDVSITAEMQEVENQKNIVHTLEDNLSIIAELYRECFYETAKQEELIDLLRKSYLDVRLMDKDKSDKINRLQNVIRTQKWSIEQCQDVVLEVESLKSEISNFLNSSNNDSGMWERGSEAPDVGEELGDILEQLRQLQDLLTGDCTCGLEEENMALKSKNKHLEMELDKIRQRMCELETESSSREMTDQQYLRQMEEKEKEFQAIRQKLKEVESSHEERGASCDTMSRQLQQAEVLLDEKSTELEKVRRAHGALEGEGRRLRRELEEAHGAVQEGLKKLMEMTQLRSQLDESRARVAELERQLQRTCDQCRELEICCREKERNALLLQSQLEEAHARGAALCEESSRVTASVRQWMRRQKALAREQQEKIRAQESMLSELQRCIEARESLTVHTSLNETEPCCLDRLPQLHACASGACLPRCSRSRTVTFPPPRSAERESEMASCSKWPSNGQGRAHSSETEIGSCSAAPVPPRRMKKMTPCRDTFPQHCPHSPRSPRGCCDPHARFVSAHRAPSPADEVVQRVELLHAALADGRRRWTRAPRR